MLYSQRRHRDRPVSYQDSGVYITYRDFKSSGVKRFIHVDKTQITVEPPPSDPPYRTLDLPRFNPVIKADYYAGNGYWINKKNTRCVSWYINTLYIDGIRHELFEFDLYHRIVAACILGNGNIAVVTSSQSGYLQYGLDITVYEKDTWAVLSDRRFYTFTFFSGEYPVYYSGFLSDCTTLFLAISTDNIRPGFIYAGMNQLFAFNFSEDYSEDTVRTISALDVSSGIDIFMAKDYAILPYKTIEYISPYENRIRVFTARLTATTEQEGIEQFSYVMGSSPSEDGYYHGMFKYFLFKNDEVSLTVEHGVTTYPEIAYTVWFNNEVIDSGLSSYFINSHYWSNRYAFDGTLLIACLPYNDHGKTYIINTKTGDNQIVNYSVDFDYLSNAFCPVSVTTLKK